MPNRCFGSSFQSTPDLINRENNPVYAVTIFFGEFQSTPDLINRENEEGTDDPASIYRFNPLPI